MFGDENRHPIEKCGAKFYSLWMAAAQKLDVYYTFYSWSEWTRKNRIKLT